MLTTYRLLTGAITGIFILIALGDLVWFVRNPVGYYLRFGAANRSPKDDIWHYSHLIAIFVAVAFIAYHATKSTLAWLPDPKAQIVIAVIVCLITAALYIFVTADVARRYSQRDSEAKFAFSWLSGVIRDLDAAPTDRFDDVALKTISDAEMAAASGQLGHNSVLALKETLVRIYGDRIRKLWP